MSNGVKIPGIADLTTAVKNLTTAFTSGNFAGAGGQVGAGVRGMQDDLVAGLNDASAAAQATGGLLGTLTAGAIDFGQVVTDITPALTQFGASQALVTEKTSMLGKALLNLPKDAMLAAIAFNKATGAGGEFDEKIISLRENLKGVPGIQEALIDSTAGLYKGFSDFSGPDGITKSEMQIAKTVAILGKLGGSIEDQTSIVQNLRMGFMMNDEQINDSLLQFEAISETLDVDLGTVMSNFAKQAPLFSTFADQGVHAFKRLQAQSKATGVEVESLVGVSEKFTTIEGAAGIVGQLQQLAPGGDLDFMALTEAALTNPSEVTNMLMDYLNDINFEILDPATQRVFSNVLDMPVPQLKALASRKVEDYEKLVKEAENATEAVLTDKVMAGSEVREVQQALLDAKTGVEGLAIAMREADKGAFQQTLASLSDITGGTGGLATIQSSIIEGYKGLTDKLFEQDMKKWDQLLANNRAEMQEAFNNMTLHITMDGDSFKGYVKRVVSGRG